MNKKQIETIVNALYNKINNKSSKNEKGRDPIVPNEEFLKAHEKSETIQDMIVLLPQLSKLSYKKARSYIVAHASYLRIHCGMSNLKYFQRGRPAHNS